MYGKPMQLLVKGFRQCYCVLYCILYCIIIYHAVHSFIRAL